MMEWDDIGIKEPTDILQCLSKGAKASELLKLYGDRISGLIAEALDQCYYESMVARLSTPEALSELICSVQPMTKMRSGSLFVNADEEIRKVCPTNKDTDERKKP